MECVETIKAEVELNPRQRRAILHLLSARTVKEAAKNAKVRLPTLYRWMKCPVFTGELERLRDEVVADTVSRLKIHSLQAVTVLADLMQNSKSESVKRGAAVDILENARAFIQMREVETRLKVLEELIENTAKAGGGYVVQRSA